MNTRFLIALAPVAAVAIAATPASAQAFTPSNDTLGNLETGFDGTVLTNTDEAGTDGVTLTANLAANGGTDGFSRVVAQAPGFNTNLSGFDSFDVEVERQTEGIGSGTLFIQTGDNFDFQESPSFSLADGATTFSLDLAGLTDTDDVRQFGFQFFGPAGGQDGQVVSIRPADGGVIPEPASLAAFGVIGGAALLRRRRSQA